MITFVFIFPWPKETFKPIWECEFEVPCGRTCRMVAGNTKIKATMKVTERGFIALVKHEHKNMLLEDFGARTVAESNS